MYTYILWNILEPREDLTIHCSQKKHKEGSDTQCFLYAFKAVISIY